MKNLIKIFFSLLILSSIAIAQQEEINTKDSNDTSKKIIKINPLSDSLIRFDEFDFYLENNNLKMNLLLDKDPGTIWLKTSILISKINSPLKENSGYLLSPLYIQHLENSKFNPIRYVLGMAQISAVGYLAYKHIKKYGLFK
jgi:3'-phosphoadenosine 5'-phosphosulfate sulfotransferase (PAPS reductase)/FAD synthetase